MDDNSIGWAGAVIILVIVWFVSHIHDGKIRDEAYHDGYNDGREWGYSEGYNDGTIDKSYKYK